VQHLNHTDCQSIISYFITGKVTLTYHTHSLTSKDSVSTLGHR